MRPTSDSMWKLLLIFVSACTAVEAVLTSLESKNQDMVLKLFRQELLEKVAVGWNSTMEQSYLLQAKTTECTGKVDRQVEECKSETKRKCEQTPTLLNELMKLVDRLINPLTFLKNPLKDIGDGLKNLGKLVFDGGKQFISSMKGLAGSAGQAVSDVFKGLQHGLNQVGSVVNNIAGGLGSIGSGISNGINKVGAGVQHVANQVGQAVGNIGNAVGNIGSGIGNAISRIRVSGWKKRRNLRKWQIDTDDVETIDTDDVETRINDEERECMQKCSSCHPLLLDQDKMVQSICGSEVTDMTKKIQARAQLLDTVYNATIDEVYPIISQVEYDNESMVGQKYTTVFLTVYIRGSYVRYQSNVAYAFMDLTGTSRAMALEYWNKMI